MYEMCINQPHYIQQTLEIKKGAIHLSNQFKWRWSKVLITVLTAIFSMTALSYNMTSVSATNTYTAHCTSTPKDSAVEQAFPGHLILIDAGHGGIDGGTSFEDILEKDINLDIAKRLYLLLRSQGFDAVLNRTGDYALSEDNHWSRTRSRHMRDLAQRQELSDEIQPSLVVSLHVNWGKNKSKGGPLVLHQDEGRSVLLAYTIQNALNQYYGTRTIPIVGKPFYLLNQNKVPSVIVEMGYISNEKDRLNMTKPSGKKELAQCIASGLSAYLMLQ
jgi:N-acetylmuramoyl-L-alanine amidase